MNDRITTPVVPQELMIDYEQMKEFASRDALTGLLNRGAMEQRIKERLQELQPEECCALFILDLDHFKAVNDTLGHQAGDQILKGAARILQSLFRNTDIVGRLGGDEFIVFLAGDVTEQLVRKKGQMICDQIQFVVGDEAQIFVTASVGIYLSLDGERKFSNLYWAADQALYQVKNSSRQNYYLSMDGRDAVATAPMRQVSALRLRSLLDNIDSGLAMVEMSEAVRFLYVSPSFALMLGRSVTEIMALSLKDIVHPDDWEEMYTRIQEHVVNNGESRSHILRVIGRSGQPIWWRVHAAQVDENEQFPVILLTAIDISEMKARERDLNDIYQVAIQQATQGIWEVDLSDKVFRMLGGSRCFPEELQNAVPFPEGLLSTGFISSDSADSFREFAQTIMIGKTQGCSNFKVLYRNTGKYGWVSFSYQSLSDKDGRPVRVMGTIDSLSRPSISVPAPARETILPESLVASLLVQSMGSLTSDELTFYRGEEKNRVIQVKDSSCSHVLQEEWKRISDKEQASFLSEFLSREKLLEQYRERGTAWLRWEYLRRNTKGKIGLVSCVIHLFVGTDGGDVRFRLWIVDLEKRRRWESRVGVPIFRMPTRDFYTRTTLREMGASILQKGGHVQCALVLLEIKGLATLGSGELDYSDRWQQDIVTALMLGLGGACLAGQFSRESYAILYPKIESCEALEHQLEQVILFVRDMAVDIDSQGKLCFLAAGSCGYQDEVGYDFLMQQAQLTLGRWQNSSGDKVIFDGESSLEKMELWPSAEENSLVRTSRLEVSRPLSSQEKDAALKGLLGIFHSASIEAAARCVLSALGEYYNADRVYIVEMADQGVTVTVPHEWTSARKWSLQSMMSGTQAKRYPMLERCIEEQKPIFLTRVKERGNEKEGSWHFAVIPMREEGITQAYLCVENAKNHISDATLANLLCTCLLKERRRYLSPVQKTMMGKDKIYNIELPNYTSYMETIYSFNSDKYNSLGVVCVDVPDFLTINNVQGFEYGRQILRQIVRSMTDIFGMALVYRTWDAEFVALCPNTSQQIFFGRCIRLWTILSRNYPKKIRMGYNWSDQGFSGKSLVDDAKALMRGGNGNGRGTKGPVDPLPLPLVQYSTVKGMIAAGCFTVYFQPKINMETGALVGAEALVRGIGDHGSVIPPLQFINHFEQEGSIRDLDFFVLDRVMSLMNRWRRQGVQIVPVSVNFSRVTLFDHCGPASVLAIQSRYSELPPDFLVAEITEGVGDIGKSTLRHAMEKFRAFGLTFALDDFGSKYSNLSVFTTVPFEEVKLDRSLIMDIHSNENSQVMVKSITELCKKNQVRCVAEGVETREQAEALCQVGCTVAQGYYYERPLPEQMFFEKYLKGRIMSNE